MNKFIQILLFMSFIGGILCIPQQLHMAQGFDSTSMVISWISSLKSESELIYGTEPTKLKQTPTTSTITQYNFKYPGMHDYSSGFIHHTNLDGLKPDTIYFFKCGDLKSNVTVSSYFRTLPLANSNPNPLVFGVIGDIGQTPDTISTLDHLNKDKLIGMILHAGDLSYANCNQTEWDTYGVLIEPISRTKPWMVGPGNHEIEFAEGSNPYLAFESRYRMPWVKPVEYGQITIGSTINPVTGMYYCTPSTFQSEYNYGNSFFSFEVGLAHVVFLNPYTTTDINSSQYKWLISDLESINRIKTPWLIVVSHCPWYNSNKAHQNETQTLRMRETFEPIFYKYGVNIVFTGHVHAYERTWPVYANEINPNAPVYIVIGDGGNNEGHAYTYLPQPKWSAYRNGTQYGYGQFIIYDKFQAEWKWFRNIDKKLIYQDKVTLYNKN